MELKPSIQQHAEMLRELSQDASFTVFLCGPTLGTENPEAATVNSGEILLEKNAGQDIEVLFRQPAKNPKLAGAVVPGQSASLYLIASCLH